ncbi:MAG: UDP-3-O-(3-hydroxymyristoyl)glucosamine N-acyltransferase [Melioribacteraceae bacterium]|nr:UDP-3-O-(3-hydroxymyristoyl)glucosamine N-acyltransferase [Melioribacteraceae bacterium]
MKIKVSEVAQLVGGTVFGNASVEFSNISRIGEAKKGDLTFLYLSSYQKYLASTNASVILVKSGIEKTRDDLTYIEVEKPDIALQKIIVEYFSPKFELEGIDDTASVHPSVLFGKNVKVGKNVVIEANCEIGDNTKIFHNTVVLKKVKIGSGVILHPNVTVREECIIGNSVIIHSGTVVGSDGFGYNPDASGKFIKVPQIGNVIIEDDVELGSNVSIDRAAIGSTVIKRGSKLDNLIQVAHNCTIGEDTVISAQTGISGSTNIGSNCMIGGQVGLTGHIDICDKTMIGAQSGVSKSITKPGTYFGSPAKEIGLTLRTEGHIRNLSNYASKIKELEKRLAELEKANKEEI